MPLFLEMVRKVAEADPALARNALAGLTAYRDAQVPAPVERRVVGQCGRARLLGYGTSGPPVVLVPSLINPSRVLDLDAGRSLLGWLGGSGYRAMLVDWGTPTRDDADLDIAGHVETLLLPLVAGYGEPVHLVGYCLGGTMAMALASILPVRSLTLLATPWHFARYPDAARAALDALWQANAAMVAALGLAPVELLQMAFWGLDPQRTVAKFAAIAGLAQDDARLTGFAALEDWANDGAPLTAAAARDLLVGFVGDDCPGRGLWRVADRPISPDMLSCPAMQIVAKNDRIAPAETAASSIRSIMAGSGHVGMVVGSRAHLTCWSPLKNWLDLH